MTDDLKARVLDLAAIAKKCPENLQEKCFELLLSDFLSKGKKPPPPAKVVPSSEIESSNEASDDGDVTQEDIQLTDLHVKAKKFLKKYGLGIDELNQVFYKEGDSFLPLFEDLKTTRTSECQVRISLLQAFQKGMQCGEFEFSGEEVREECSARKCYDKNNFPANFKNNATLFDKFTKYARTEPNIRLSENGRKELADLLKELA